MTSTIIRMDADPVAILHLVRFAEIIGSIAAHAATAGDMMRAMVVRQAADAIADRRPVAKPSKQPSGCQPRFEKWKELTNDGPGAQGRSAPTNQRPRK